MPHLLADIENLLAAIDNLDSKALARFTDIAAEAFQFRTLSSYLQATGLTDGNEALQILPFEYLTNMYKAALQLTTITDVRVDANKVDKAIGQFREAYRLLFVPPTIATLLLMKVQGLPGDLDRLKEHFAGAGSAAERSAASAAAAEESAQASAKQARLIVASAQDLVATKAAEHQSTHFARTAAEHARAATRWLNTAIVSASVLLLFVLVFCAGFGFWLFTPPAFEPTISGITSRAATASLILVAISFAIGNYRRRMHLWTVHLHKSLALETFTALANGARDDVEARRAVLEGAARCIFSTPPTGFARQSEAESLLHSAIHVRQVAGGGNA